MCNKPNKQPKESRLGFLGMCLRMQPKACVCMLRTCVRGTYSRALTRKPETENRAQIKKPNSNYLACSEHKQNYKTNLSKHIKT